ncbi:hypothetical protein GDO78_014594 [Eleutherodactylus coqui]|uniref:AB hydrolase-1 domain-containing protein n=1 Tax=Eleutherodactylus coqui TaxID=57060 RepID=A0A8J6ELF5_ELECQ|nr:hypothetical protein GDO78_014594 [Eleutherodactylus coqui]
MGLGRHKLVVLVLILSVSVLLYLLLPSARPERDEPKAEVPRAEPQDSMNFTVRTATLNGDWPTFYREAAPRSSPEGAAAERFPVLLLHGRSFTSKTWEELGTLQILSEHGYQAVAIDLPGNATKPNSLESLQHLPNHTLSPLKGAGHACYMDRPEEFHTALLMFLSKL